MTTYNLGRVGFVPKGEFSATTNYEKYDIVSYNGNGYVALVNVAGVLPTDDATKWKLFIDNSAALSIAVAAEYSPTGRYAVGDYCMHEGRLYCCVTAITADEPWTSSHWEEVQLGDEINELKTAVANAQSLIGANSTAIAGRVKKPNTSPDGSNGQLLRSLGNGETQWVNEGLPTDAQTAQAVSDWLDDHPEATTTVADSSLTEAKFSNALKLKSIKDYVTPEMFGAVGDGETDDTNAFVSAFNYCKENNVYFYVPPKTYYTTDSCIMTYAIRTFDCIIQGNVSYLKFIGTPTRMMGVYVYIRKATTVIFQDFKGLEANVVSCDNLYVYANTTNGSAYNSFYGAYAGNIVLQGLVDRGWVNENKFRDFRCMSLSIIGNGYHNNNNRFYDICLESGTITLDSANSNYIQLRGEGGYTLTKNSAEFNTIYRTYIGSNATLINNDSIDAAFNTESYENTLNRQPAVIYRLDGTRYQSVDKKITIPKWADICSIYIKPTSAFKITTTTVTPASIRAQFRQYNALFENITGTTLDFGAAIGVSYNDQSEDPAFRWTTNRQSIEFLGYEQEDDCWIKISINVGNEVFESYGFNVYLSSLKPVEYFVDYDIAEQGG